MPRLDLYTVEPPVRASVDWTEKDHQHGHTYRGIVRFVDAPGEEYRITLVRGRFGAGANIYPLTQYTYEELAASNDVAIPLPAAIARFEGDDFTLDGANAGKLYKQPHQIELLDELPEGYDGPPAYRDTLRRQMDPTETRAVWAKLGFDLSNHEFDSFEEINAARMAAREAREQADAAS